ncbi:elongation factor P [Candidatus Roizmanbacteria bacterium RIFCSPHIGHO2_12_FULL_41_11]|uniref:Elongation factor P n=3 Tax=Candidatus Roizmaniibacteriota TaxID=1752723 RepID=A0A1F7JRK0_9BACT|nr:MAG: elongation factor P [Candidatus Roizmanbacteria bacterium RIFCSPHIGHO2_12_FULL_41_11]OGK51879.1 MAG: elongation factor P [Candidatus Roizmanbacteria bacterium RIFCSPLOWO2_01_FULL_41_22]OGK58246.1 MAG: elongation factor P [Candidatus Roizmanbacteria bacterium RIFCSPLOWO2_02_FULL_41_9]
MTRISAGNLKKGEFIIYQNETWQLQKAEFYSPGKGSALMRAKIKNVISGKNIDYTFKSSEYVETIEVESVEMQYLYKDNENAYYMDERTYNQYTVPLAVIGEAINFFKEGEKMFVYVQNEKPLCISPPMSVRLRVTETEDGVKGDTVSGAKKTAILETGASILVPLFVKKGDIITLNPEIGEYVGREKEI